jgi:hypothetical protein
MRWVWEEGRERDGREMRGREMRDEMGEGGEKGEMRDQV